MKTLQTVINSRALFWLILASPAYGLVLDVWQFERYYAEIMYESGTYSVILMIVALAITPLLKITGNWKPVFWLLKRRRSIGVASFGYAALHTFFYVRYVGTFELVVLEAIDLAYLLGWVSFFGLLILALTSNNWSVRKLGKYWKHLQRFAYLALAVSFLHWLWIDQFIPELTYWAATVAALQIMRIGIGKIKAQRPTKSLPQ